MTMTDTNSFEGLISRLRSLGRKVRVAAECPNDNSSAEALKRAAGEGWIEPIVVDNADPAQAAAEAVAMAHRGESDVLMKGLISSDILLRAILNKEVGLLRRGEVLTHTAVAEMPGYHKLVAYSDAAVIPYPTQEQRISQTRYLATLCHGMGIDCPRISLIHCSEHIDERHFPHTGGYADIIERGRQGEFGPCIIDGPLDLKTSMCPESLAVKGIDSPVGGDADALVFPDIEAANVFHKTITLLASARIAAVLQGPDVPVVMPSRASMETVKFVPKREPLRCVMSGRFSLSASSGAMGRQMRPRPNFAMKLMASGVANSAAMVRSPSFSRSSSSTRMIILPCLSSATASSTEQRGMAVSFLAVMRRVFLLVKVGRRGATVNLSRAASRIPRHDAQRSLPCSIRACRLRQEGPSPSSCET